MRRMLLVLTVGAMMTLVLAVAAGPVMANVRFDDVHDNGRSDNDITFVSRGGSSFDSLDIDLDDGVDLDDDIDLDGDVDIDLDDVDDFDFDDDDDSNIDNSQFVTLGGGTFGDIDLD